MMVVKIFVDFGCFFEVGPRVPLFGDVEGSREVSQDGVALGELEVPVDDGWDLPVGIDLREIICEVLSQRKCTSPLAMRVWMIS